MRYPIHFQVNAKSSLPDCINLKKSSVHGLGLFATERITKGTTIHTTHFKHPPDGWINLVPNCRYNHSEVNENCEIITLESPQIKQIRSLVDIPEGQELFVDYTKDPDLEQPIESWEK